VGRIDAPDQRNADAQGSGDAQRLRGAGDDQRGKAVGRQASQRGQQEQSLPALIHPPVAHDIAQRGKRQQRH